MLLIIFAVLSNISVFYSFFPEKVIVIYYRCPLYLLKDVLIDFLHEEQIDYINNDIFNYLYIDSVPSIFNITEKFNNFYCL